MQAILKRVVLGTGGTLLLGASVALSSAAGVSGAPRVHPDKNITCAKSSEGYCFTVRNSGTGNAMQGEAGSGAGVFGNSNSGLGIAGVSSSVDGGSFANDSTEYYSLYAYAAAGTSSYPFGAEAYNGSQLTGYFVADGSGDGYFSGSVTATGFNTALRTRGGAHVAAFTATSTRATLEDDGTARLTSGEGVVRFDPTFASTIDATRGYQVFLTPNGESRGWLYVAAKYEGGFIVREAERGRSSISFDYRILAHPYASTDARLPTVNIKLGRGMHIGLR